MTDDKDDKDDKNVKGFKGVKGVKQDDVKEDEDVRDVKVYRPNPLVTALAQELKPGDVTPEQVDDYRSAWELAARAPDDEDEKRQAKARWSAVDELAQDLASALATDAAAPELVILAGFVGGLVETDGDYWRIFYLDAKLRTWLLVDNDDIVLCRPFKDETAPFGQRDVMWLRSSASVIEGSGPARPLEIAAQFLRGDFIGAGDFAASLTGGTFSRATGLLCEVQTPGCCGKKTR